MTISLRNLPPEIETVIADTSRLEGISLNKATIRILEGILHKPVRNEEFDEFLGQWSESEAADFDTALHEMRRIEPLDWDTPR